VLDTSVKARLEQMKVALSAACPRREPPVYLNQGRKESCNSIPQRFPN
jgi:hypothetical protein